MSNDPAMEVLLRNLAAIDVADPELGQRLRWGVDGSHVVATGRGPALRIHWTDLPLVVDPQSLLPKVMSFDPAQPLLVFGVGLGETVRAALDGFGGPVVAWDQDPWMLRLALMAHDWSEALREGRLRLTLGSDVWELAGEDRTWQRLDHPLFIDVYRNERDVITRGQRPSRALVCAGTLMVDDLADALRERRHSVLTWSIKRDSKEELVRAARAFAPDVVFAINYTYGLAETCEELGVPLRVWEIDPSTDPLRPLAAPSPSTRVFTYREAHVARFTEAGFEDTRYLPLAGHPKRRRPEALWDLAEEKQAPYRTDVAFVGSSMVKQAREFRATFVARAAALEGRPADEVERRLDEILAEQARDETRFVLPPLLEASFPTTLATPPDEENPADPVMLVAEIAASTKRLSWIGRLGELGVHVWGGPGWEALADTGATLRGPAGYLEELTRIYAGTRVNVDIGRLYQSDIVTVRVFDCLLSGGFLLTEHSDALEELFTPGVHLDTYRTADELVDKVRWWCEHEDERARAAVAGRAHALEHHTVAKRVALILND